LILQLCSYFQPPSWIPDAIFNLTSATFFFENTKTAEVFNKNSKVRKFFSHFECRRHFTISSTVILEICEEF
jgi:hypothetical protein